MRKKFTDCVDLAGRSCKNFSGTKRYISTRAIDENHINENDVEIIDFSGKPSRANLVVLAGDAIFAKMQATKKTLLIDDELAECIYSTGFYAVHAKKNVIKEKCLFYLLTSDAFLKQKDKNCSGATQKAITNTGLKKIIVNIPDYKHQDEVVEKLDAVSRIISLYQNELKCFDELVKARFVEMFGTYPSNPMRWETATIRDIVTDVRYGSSRPAVDGGKYPYLRMNNITYGGELDLTDTKRIDIPDNELDKCTVRRGDVLFNRTNSKELVGKTCVYNRDEMMVLAGFVIRVRVTERILPEFLSTFLNTDFSKQMLLGMCKAAIGQANINAQEMQSIGIYLPPTELQRQFVQFKEQVDKSKVAV